MLMDRNLWSGIDAGTARRRAPIWLVTGLVALGAAAASCADSEPVPAADSKPAPAGEVGPAVQLAQSAITDETICLNGNIADAMAGMRRAKGILVKPRGALDGASDFSWLDDHALSGCHIQGIANLGTSGIVVDFNKAAANNTFPANLLGRSCPEYDPNVLSRAKLIQMPGGDPTFSKSIEIAHNAKVYHPSGMASVGRILFLAMTGPDITPYIFIYDYSQAIPLLTPPTLVTSFAVSSIGSVDSLAAGYDPATNSYHIILNQDSQNRLVVLRSVGNLTSFHIAQRMTVDNGRYPGKRKSQLNYQGMSLIRQCDGQMYLLGLTINNYPDCAGNFDSCDDSIIDYAPYNPDPNNLYVGAWQTTGALDNPCNGFLDLDICPNFAAGATAFVGTNHKLFAWATEHWPEGRPGDLDILTWSQP
jgi:hypothetical protein